MNRQMKNLCISPIPIMFGYVEKFSVLMALIFIIILLIFIIRIVTIAIKRSKIWDNFTKKSVVLLLSIILYLAMWFTLGQDTANYLLSSAGLFLIVIADIWIFRRINGNNNKILQLITSLFLVIVILWFSVIYLSRNTKSVSNEVVDSNGLHFEPLSSGGCGTQSFW